MTAGLSLCRSRTPRGLDEELDTGDAKFFQVIEQLNSQKYGDLKRAGRAGGQGSDGRGRTVLPLPGKEGNTFPALAFPLT